MNQNHRSQQYAALRQLWLSISMSALLVSLLLGCEASVISHDSGTSLGDGGMGAFSDEVLGLPDQIYWFDGEGIVESSWEFGKDEEGEALVIVEGDISLGSPNEALAVHQEIEDGLSSDVGSQSAALLLETRDFRQWDDGLIRYVMSDTFKRDPGRVKAVRDAVAEWNQLTPWTGLRWEERDNLSKRKSHAIFRTASDGRCHSDAHGRRMQAAAIHLSPGCFNLRIIMHEMGHQMGMLHEQQRSDRDRYVYHMARNTTSARLSNYSRYRDRPWSRNVGMYDVQSIMHYDTLGFSTPVKRGARLPVLLDRGSLDLVRIHPSYEPVRRPLYNSHVRINGRGIDLDKVLVVDVDGDDMDDLVTEFGDELVFSARGSRPWQPIRPGGKHAAAGLDNSAVGDFDGDGKLDLLSVNALRWTVAWSDGRQATTTRSVRVRDVEVADIDDDGHRDVFVVGDDGKFYMASGQDVLGPLRRLSSAGMSSDDVKLVRLSGMKEAVHAVAWVDETLCHVDLRGALSSPVAEWKFVFGKAGRGPLPETVDEIGDLWFVNVDENRGPWTDVDIIAASDGQDGSGMPARAPAWISNVLGSTAIGMQPFPMPENSGFIGVDMSDEIAVGYFFSYSAFHLLTLGSIPLSDYPSMGDVLGIGAQYAPWSRARLSDRYPLASNHDVASNYSVPNMVAGEFVELEASFVSAAGKLSVVDRRLWRLNQYGARTLIEESQVPVGGSYETVQDVFVADEPGRYLFEFSAPLVRRGRRRTKLGDSAGWEFRVSGRLCGDGVLDIGEKCDDGIANSDDIPDACRSSCRAATCGDSVLDQGETCDAGRLNSDTTPESPCRSNCALWSCGDGVLDGGEECDDGPTNSNENAGACRETCVRAYCGDGVRDAGESCDDGDQNSDVAPNACRKNCVPSFCGDGITDATEYCDGGICDSDCTCPPTCGGALGSGVCICPR